MICPSMLYGTGRGLKPDDEQIPRLIALSKQLGGSVYIRKGLNRYSNVHIDDLVDLYVLVLEKATGGSSTSERGARAPSRKVEVEPAANGAQTSGGRIGSHFATETRIALLRSPLHGERPRFQCPGLPG